MFQIGLFSSYIPYMVMAIMYVLYIGMYSLNKYNAEHQTDMQENKGRTTITVTDEGPDLYNLAQFEIFANAEAEPAEESTATYSTGSEMLRILRIPRKVGVKKKCFCFAIFSRPPPAIS